MIRDRIRNAVGLLAAINDLDFDRAELARRVVGDPELLLGMYLVFATEASRTRGPDDDPAEYLRRRIAVIAAHLAGG